MRHRDPGARQQARGDRRVPAADRGPLHGGARRRAFLNGARLRPSVKTDLAAALVGTGQAKPGEDAETHRRVGRSVTAMLDSALVTRVSVPATLQLVQVAAGRMDLFWQYSDVRSGLLAGALLVAEAGGSSPRPTARRGRCPAATSWPRRPACTLPPSACCPRPLTRRRPHPLRPTSLHSTPLKETPS
ncbi:hypothetical protein NKH77_48965 [Streptomyces sp. M19]